MVAVAPRSARCACGQLKITCFSEPVSVSACHCLECQSRTGSAFGVAAFYASQDVSIEGESRVYSRESDSGFPVEHHFCPECGTTVYWYPQRKPDQVAVAVGCFRDYSFPAPIQQVYQHHQFNWVKLALGARTK